MRVITGVDPNSVSSPIGVVMENLHSAIINIAPEKKN